jgi:hypothetical protein
MAERRPHETEEEKAGRWIFGGDFAEGHWSFPSRCFFRAA